MIRTIVRYFTTKIPKPLAPHKPKASIDFVSKDVKNLYDDIFYIG